MEGSFNDSEESKVFKFYVKSSLFPLKCTLTWFDPPNLIGGGALVNNLNLKITTPNGTTYYLENDFTDQWSNSNGVNYDTLNNSEGVRIQSPLPGLWKSEIYSQNLPQSTQPYALVCSGNVTYYIPPKPIPDGSGGTVPMKAFKTSSNGETIQVNWDDHCAPTNANIIYGKLSGISSYTLDGSKCDISNPDTWNIGTTTNIWFITVTDEGQGTESSWGSSSTGPRYGTNASGMCGNSTRDNTGTCP